MIDQNEVNKIFDECMLKEHEQISNPIIGIGLECDYHFHPERLEAHRPKITAMTKHLPDKLKRSQNPHGLSAIHLAEVGNHGKKWTECQLDVCELLALGNALQLIKLPVAKRKLWPNLSGGKPFVIIEEN